MGVQWKSISRKAHGNVVNTENIGKAALWSPWWQGPSHNNSNQISCLKTQNHINTQQKVPKLTRGITVTVAEPRFQNAIIDRSHTGMALGYCWHIRTKQLKPGLKKPHLSSALIPVSAFTGNDFDVSFFLLHRDVLFLEEETKAFALPSYPRQKYPNFIKHLLLSVSQDSFLVTDWTLMVQLIKLMAIS